MTRSATLRDASDHDDLSGERDAIARDRCGGCDTPVHESRYCVVCADEIDALSQPERRVDVVDLLRAVLRRAS